MNKSDRMHLRISPMDKAHLDRAAAAVGEGASEFLLRAGLDRADQVVLHPEVNDDTRTVVSESFFYELLACLDRPVNPAPKLAESLAQARDSIRSDCLTKP